MKKQKENNNNKEIMPTVESDETMGKHKNK